MYHDYHKITTYSYSSWAEMTCSNITSSGLCLVSFIFIPVGSVSCALRPQGEEVWFGISFFQYLIHHHTSLTDQYFLEHPQSCFSPPTHPVGADGGPVLSQRPGACAHVCESFLSSHEHSHQHWIGLFNHPMLSYAQPGWLTGCSSLTPHHKSSSLQRPTF